MFPILNPPKTLNWLYPDIGGSGGSQKIHLFKTSECSTHCNLEALPAGYSAIRFHLFGPESLLLLAVLLFFSTYIVHSIPSPRLPPFLIPTWKSPSVQFSSATQSCLTLCDPMNRSTPGLPVHHQLLEFTQTHVHRVGDAIQPSHPLSRSPSY